MQGGHGAHADRLRRLPAPRRQQPRGHPHRSICRALRQGREPAAGVLAMRPLSLHGVVKDLGATLPLQVSCCRVPALTASKSFRQQTQDRSLATATGLLHSLLMMLVMTALFISLQGRLAGPSRPPDTLLCRESVLDQQIRVNGMHLQAPHAMSQPSA